MTIHKSIIKNSYADQVKILLVVLASLAVIFYVIFELKSLVTGPDLTIYHPVSGPSEINLVTLTGEAKRADSLIVNGNNILLDNEEKFATPLFLLEGYNIITIEATDRFGKTNKQQLTIVGPVINANNN